MLDLAWRNYSAAELLRDGRSIEIRALRPDDEAQMLAAISRASPQSVRRRFFGARRDFSESEKAFFLNVNFTDHVALVATIAHDGHSEIAGGARYVLVQPDIAEVAFMVIDEFQGRGVGTALMRHLIFLARSASLKRLVADILPENTAMLNVFQKTGLHQATTRSQGVVRVELDLR
jgi:RimJ/RimL family protein N-acetyltransferase